MAQEEVLNKSHIKEVAWDDVREQVKKVNPELHEIIDQLATDRTYKLYKGCYPYGYESVKQGKLFWVNSEGQAVPLTDHSIDNQLKNELGYNLGSNPVSLVLKNSFEIFIIVEDHTIPFVVVPQGKMLSTWLVLEQQHDAFCQPAFLWNVSAGSRSIFMLPKISTLDKYNYLRKEFKLKNDVPRRLLDHGEVFKELANSPYFGDLWTAEILYFGKKWFGHLEDQSHEWMQFYNYLYKKAWSGSEYWRTAFVWDMAFSLIQKWKNLRPNPYIADTVKHLLAMSIGAYPGFAPSTGDDLAPVSRLQEIIVGVYKLNDYAPIIVQPAYFSVQRKNRPVYYSLQYPTTIGFSPKARKAPNKIMDLIEIQYLLGKYLSQIASNRLNLNGTPIALIPEKVKYDFFHSEQYIHEDVKNSSEIPEEDASFNVKKYADRKIPIQSTFLKGCVRISNT